MVMEEGMDSMPSMMMDDRSLMEMEESIMYMQSARTQVDLEVGESERLSDGSQGPASPAGNDGAAGATGPAGADGGGGSLAIVGVVAAGGAFIAGRHG